MHRWWMIAIRAFQPRCCRYALILLLAIHGGLLAVSGHVHSPTLNEPAHAVAGISNWRSGGFDIYNVNPPLTRVVAAIPLSVMSVEIDWSRNESKPHVRSEFMLGEDFVAANCSRFIQLFTLARWACIPFGLVGCCFCYCWARELYGPSAGILAASLWCFCPNILGHGGLITPDVAATAFAVGACYTFWQWLVRPTWLHTVISGAMLGLAELTKTTLIIFLPLWPLLWLVYRFRQSNSRWPDLGREAAMLAVRTVIAIYVINCGYLFEGSFTRLKEFRFLSTALSSSEGRLPNVNTGTNRFADTWLGSLPVPVPKNYIAGIDLQRLDFENYMYPSYLRGTFRRGGWWYYYLYALAIKVPLGTWLLILLAATRGIWWRTGKQTSHGSRSEPVTLADGTTQRVPAVPAPLANGTGQIPATSTALSHDTGPVPATLGTTWRDEFILVAPAFIILIFVSSQTGFSEHMRYALPIFPFFFVWISRVAVVFEPNKPHEPSGDQSRPSGTEVQSEVQDISPARLEGPTRNRTTRQRIIAGLIIASLAWSIINSLSVYPHSLSYFNELVGGPTGGPKHLIHSNVDWGQDLLFLKKWLDKHPEARPLKLAYFGYFDPKYAGIEYSAPEVPSVGEGEDPVDAPIPPGWYAVSVNFVQGLPYFSYKGDGTKVSYGLKELARFQRLEPVAMAGYSIYIYHVE